MHYSPQTLSGFLAAGILATQAAVMPPMMSVTEIESTALESKITTLRKRDIVRVLSSNPHDGEFAILFPDEDSMKASPAYYPSNGTPDPVFAIRNDENERLGIWMEINGKKMQAAGHEYQEFFMMPPGSRALVRVPTSKAWNGAIRAFTGCDEDGRNCFGHLGAATKLEWTAMPTGQGWINLSIVDGYNVAMRFTPEVTGPRCRTVTCSIPPETVYDICPKDGLHLFQEWRDGKDHVMCKSDCAATQSPYHCCAVRLGTCAPSNQHFAPYCGGDAYLYALDDTALLTCQTGGLMHVYLGIE